MAVSDRIAVMHQGSVVQEGTAEDLYHRPVSQFVAQFVGRVNLVAGRVAVIAGDTVKVAALGTVLDIRSAPKDLASGASVQLVIRPETIEIVSAQSGSPQATVESRTFLGEKIEYVVRCGGEALQVVRYSAGPGEAFPVGATISLRFGEDAVTVLPATPAESHRDA
jgi:ABC-type Fe3+/spermidine/putrescine transport system ATPase subunit